MAKFRVGILLFVKVVVRIIIYRNIAILKYKINKMGASKTENFSDNQNQIAILAKALGHPARIAIIEYLLKVDSCICGDIVNELPLSQPTVSQHLRELKSAGIIKGSIEGNAICYCLDESVLKTIKQFFSGFTDQLVEKNKNCC